MRIKTVFVGLWVATLPVMPTGAAEELSQALQVGLLEEEANQNLPAAIEAYQKVLELHESQRQLAATALFRLGECHRKLGQTNEAVAQYERLLREYPGQSVLANLSRQNLAGLGHAPMAESLTAMSPAARLEQEALLEEELALMKQEVAVVERMVEAGHEPVLTLSAAKRRLLALQRQLALIKETPSTNPAYADEEQAEVRRIQALIKNSPDLINAANQPQGYTPLLTAAERGQLLVARFLLDNGAEVNRPASQQGRRTPLHGAAGQGHQTMTELLIERGADVGAQSNQGTPLHLAAEKGYRAVCQVLLEAKAPVNALGERDETPLHIAARRGHADMVELLLRHGADPNLLSQPEPGLPVQPQTPPPTSGTPLHMAFDKPEIIDLLLRHGAKPDAVNKDGHAALHYAAAWGLQREARRLLEAGAAVDIPVSLGDWHPGWTPLHYVLLRPPPRNPDMLRLLLGAGADPDRLLAHHDRCASQAPLHLAVRGVEGPLVNVLLEFKAQPNVTNACMETPLALAASGNRNAPILEALLARGAHPDAGLVNGRHPLHLAIANGDLEMATLLLRHHADANLRDQLNEATPLHVLAASWQSRIMAWTQQSPNLPQLLIVQQQPLELARLLLEHSADVNARDASGRTPLQLMGIPAHPKNGTLQALAGLLREHGALDTLPELAPDPESIRAWRPGEGGVQGVTLFVRSTNWVNHFTLLDTLLGLYTGGAAPRTLSSRPQPTLGQPRQWPQDYDFPDLASLRIRRLNPDGSYDPIPVDIRALFLEGSETDCTRDPVMRFGDVLEIPERTRALNERPVGLTGDERTLLGQCRQGNVTLVVGGQSFPLRVWYGNGRYLSRVLKNSEATSVLRTSSDLSRVKVTRQVDGKKQEFIVDTTRETKDSEDLLLEYGDIIEVPERGP